MRGEKLLRLFRKIVRNFFKWNNKAIIIFIILFNSRKKGTDRFTKVNKILRRFAISFEIVLTVIGLVKRFPAFFFSLEISMLTSRSYQLLQSCRFGKILWICNSFLVNKHKKNPRDETKKKKKFKFKFDWRLKSFFLSNLFYQTTSFQIRGQIKNFPGSCVRSVDLQLFSVFVNCIFIICVLYADECILLLYNYKFGIY